VTAENDKIERSWARGAAGSASQWHCEGQGFDPPRVHRLGWCAILAGPMSESLSRAEQREVDRISGYLEGIKWREILGQKLQFIAKEQVVVTKSVLRDQGGDIDGIRFGVYWPNGEGDGAYGFKLDVTYAGQLWVRSSIMHECAADLVAELTWPPAMDHIGLDTAIETAVRNPMEFLSEVLEVAG
jgi:hypothetical protein